MRKKMKKIIQLSGANTENGYLHCLTEDGKVYYWGYQRKVTPITEEITPLTISTGVERDVYGWVEMIDGLHR